MIAFDRVLAIARTDLKLRLRRPATLVLFLLMAVGALFMTPDPRTGIAMIQVSENGHRARALYNSSAMALGTASYAVLLLALFGYYILSGTLRRDLTTRAGFLIASTPVSDLEYLLGKYLGNCALLTTLVGFHLVNSLAVFMWRGEARLEPGQFLLAWFILFGPFVTFLSAVALLFECTPGLRGKFGDFVYFFLWSSGMGVSMALYMNGHPRIARLIDFFGFTALINMVRTMTGNDDFSIGATGFDATVPAAILPHLPVSAALLADRLVCLVLPLALLLPARWLFPRFNPDRVKIADRAAGDGWIARINRLLRPLAAPLLALAPQPRARGLVSAALLDLRLTLVGAPLALLALAGVNAAALLMPTGRLQSGLLPLLAVGWVAALADVVPRDRQAGVLDLLYAAPRLRENYPLWKFLSALLLALGFALIPALRLLPGHPGAGLSLLTAAALFSAAAVALGLFTGSAKAYLVCGLLWLYIALNDKGVTPALDVLGAAGNATAAVRLGYLAAAALLLAAAALFHRRRLARA